MNPRLLIAGLLGVVMTGYIYSVPDARLFRDPAMARILFTHVPSAFVASIFFVIAAWAGLQVLGQGRILHRARLHAAVELGALFAAFTMATGILFSRVQWGEWWHNDPRQTSFLIVLLSYLALLGLRGAFSDPEKRDKTTAAYAVALLLPAIFLTFIYPRLPHVAQQSFHPSTTIPKGQLDTAYQIGLWGNVTAFLVLAFFVYGLRVRQELHSRALENLDDHLPDSHHDSPDSRVRRPVAVRRED